MSAPGFDIPDQGRASVGMGSAEKIQVAADLLFGLSKKDAEILAGLRTTQGQPLFPGLRAAQADFSASSFANVLANTLHRRLVTDYKEANFHEEKLISVKKNVKDFRPQEAVMVGYLGDLDTVAKVV